MFTFGWFSSGRDQAALPLIFLTLKNLAEGSFHLSREGVSVAGRLIPAGVDLTAPVEEFIRKESRTVAKVS